MPQTSSSPIQLIRKLLPYTTVAAILALIYIAWVFYARSSQNRELQRETEQKTAEQARKTYEMYGSGQLKILLFYATPAVVKKGLTTQLCYSVSNATSVKIEPDVADIKPSLSHCVPVKPTSATTYTMTASDDQGHRVTQNVDVLVR